MRESFCRTKAYVIEGVPRDDGDPEKVRWRRAQETGPDRLSSEVAARLMSHPTEKGREDRVA